MSHANLLQPLRGLRRKVPSNLPATYMNDRMKGDLSPTIASPPLQYVAEIDRFVSPERKQDISNQEDALFVDTRKELQQLREAISHFRQKPHQVVFYPISSDERECTWTTVQEEIASAIKAQGPDNESQSAKSWCFKIVENIPAFETWLSLLPGGDYGAVVCGVFNMVVGAAKRANEVRVAVFKALADIPNWIAHAARYRTLYEDQKPQALAKRTAQLCSAVLVALRHTMNYLAEGTFKKIVKGIGQGPTYKQKLLDSLDGIRDLTVKIDLEASICSQYRLKDLQDEQANTQQMLGQVLRGQEALPQDLMNRFESYVVNSMFSHLLSSPYIDQGLLGGTKQLRFLASQGSLTSSELEKRAEIIGKEELLSTLGVLPDVPYQDLDLCLSKIKLLSLIDQDRIKWMMKSQQFQAWLRSSTSRVLLLNGNSGGNETFSPATCLSAKLLDTLNSLEPVITSHFFCSLHTTPRNGVEDDAVAMMELFIGQLLLCDQAWDLKFLEQNDLSLLGKSDLDSLSKLFRGLLQQLPSMTFFFLVIDGITFYERANRRVDFLKVILELLNIMEDCKNLNMKLLLSCHGRSAFVKDLVDDDDIMVVPVAVDGDFQGWNEYAWERSVGHDIQTLEKVVSQE